jgi:hypothetical protein
MTVYYMYLSLLFLPFFFLDFSKGGGVATPLLDPPMINLFHKSLLYARVYSAINFCIITKTESFQEEQHKHILSFINTLSDAYEL